MLKCKKLVSLILAIIMSLSLVVPVYADESITKPPAIENGTGGGYGGGGGTGTMSQYRTGYRYYLVDRKTGQQVSDTLDILQGELPGFKIGWIFTNTKFQDTTVIGDLGSSWNWAGGSKDTKQGKWIVKTFDSVNKAVGFKNTPPNPVSFNYSTSKFYGAGDQFREWFMRNAPLKFSSNSNWVNIKKTGPTGGTGNTTPNSTPIPPSTPNTTWVLSSIAKKATLTWQNMHKTGHSYAGGAFVCIYTREQAYTAACHKAASEGAALFSRGVLSRTPENEKLVAAYVAEACDLMDHEIPYTGWYTDAAWEAYQTWIKYHTTKLELTDYSWLTPVYAAESGGSGSGSDAKDDNIYKLLEYKINGEFVFMPHGMTEATLAKVKNKDNILVPNITATCAQKGYAVMVEPIIWIKPAVCVFDTSTGKYTNSNASYFFYGTPTNYAQLNLKGLYDDHGTGSWYWSAINGTFANCMKLKDDFTRLDGTTVICSKPTTGENDKILNSTLGNTKLGYGLHAYYFPLDSGLPSTQTYDVTEVDPNPDPHPAPNPDPNYPTPENPTIPLGNAEPKDPGDKPTKDNPNPENEGYLNTTRNIHIVKVYEKRNIDGTFEHVSTQYRESNPGDIAIVNEPNYKVVGYFTSPQFYDWLDGVEPMNENTPWEAFYYNDDIPKHTEENDTPEFDLCPKYNWVMDEANFEPEVWKKLTDPNPNNDKKDPLMQSGVARDSVSVGVYYNPLSEGENLTDEELAQRYPDWCPYYDNTLYVRLLYVETPPSTHTWDKPNYPTGEPGPAPDPTKDPENPVDKNSRFLHYRIVKVYEEQNEDTGEITHVETTVRYPTVPIIYIEDELQYRLIEWKYGNPYSSVDSSTEWEDPAISNVIPVESGTKTTVVDIHDENDSEYTKEVTLYVRLRKKVKTPSAAAAMLEDLTESQLTKISNTNSRVFGWNTTVFTATVEAAQISHSYYNHVGCSSKHIHSSCEGGCKDESSTCSHMSRQFGDQTVWSLYSMKESWRNEHETKVSNPNAHSDFAGKMYGKGGTVADSIKFEELTLDDKAHSDDWNLGTLTSDGSETKGIEYITTISRIKAGDKLHLALYKKSAMDANSYARVNTIFSAKNNPGSDKRLANGTLTKQIKYTVGYTDKDNELYSKCGGSTETCTKHHEVTTSPKQYVTLSDPATLSGSFKIHTYGGKQNKTANKAPINISRYAVSFGDKTTTNSALFVKQQSDSFKFYPYIKMSYQITLDNINFPGYNADSSTANSRTVYMLSDKSSTITPTNSVEVSWFNAKQQSGDVNHYGLQMTSQQWSVHSRATSDTDGSTWRQKNRVLPGGALYMLSTKDTETYIKTTTYNNLVEDDTRSWITADTSKYTPAAIAKSTSDYLTEAENVIDNYRIVEWVTSDPSVETKDTSDKNVWDYDSTKTVKIMNGGESLSNLGLNTKASTDSKYLLFAGSENSDKGASEGDIDFLSKNYVTTVYHVFTDTNGKVYIALITVNTERDKLDEATLKSVVDKLKTVTGTTLNKSSIPGLPSNMTYKCLQIGSKDDSTNAILTNLKNNPETNGMYIMDVKTKYITNSINSVERNTGSDILNATWIPEQDGKWYNEAFDGTYMVVQTATYKVGLNVPNKRVSVLDPNLCPAKSSTGDIYSKAYMAQFCLDWKSSVAQGEDDGYVGTFEGTKVYMPDLNTMFYSRSFFIPNANVQDLT